MILVLTNADTEILALRSVVEGLPAGFPPVRAARPVEVPNLDGVTMILVRLLGGRRAWEEQFDELRRRCIDAGMDQHLANPFRRHELEKALREAASG